MLILTQNKIKQLKRSINSDNHNNNNNNNNNNNKAAAEGKTYEYSGQRAVGPSWKGSPASTIKPPGVTK
jgi:hypothetical protein